MLLPYKATEVAQLFLENVYKLHGLPTKLITDRDPVFTSIFWKEPLAARAKLALDTV